MEEEKRERKKLSGKKKSHKRQTDQPPMRERKKEFSRLSRGSQSSAGSKFKGARKKAVRSVLNYGGAAAKGEAAGTRNTREKAAAWERRQYNEEGRGIPKKLLWSREKVFEGYHFDEFS